jgi:excisionase family DNA binding protein
VQSLLTAEQVADLLGVKKSWVYAEARANRIPHVRLGRYTRFNAESVSAWVAERERGPLALPSSRGETPRRSER